MSYQASLDQDEPIQVASNQGWYDFTDWLDTLDVDRHPKLAFLNEEGHNQPAGEVADELESALESDPPGDGSIEDTAMGLIAFIRRGDPDAALVVSQGFAPGGAEDEGASPDGGPDDAEDADGPAEN